MIHNGIEYGLMQAYAEGFELMHSKDEFNLDLHQIAEIWRHGSVVRSWLLDLTARALEENPDPGRHRGLCAGFGRGPLDGGRGHRAGCARSGDQPGAAAAFPSAAIRPV